MKFISALLKSVLFIKLWRIKNEIIGLILPILIVWIATNEYESYLVIHPQNSYLGWAYIIKWLVILAAIAVFIMRLNKGESSHKKTSNKTSKKTKGSKNKKADDIKKEAKPSQDRFDYLRHKDKLESKADKILQGKPYE